MKPSKLRLDLEKIKQNIDAALDNETKESLTTWLMSKRKSNQEEMVFRKIDVKERLPEKPVRPKGGQQVNIARIEWGIEKVVLFPGHDMPAIVGFHYESKKWYMGWDCRSGIVDESKYKDVTVSVTHWLEEAPLSSLIEEAMPTEEEVCIEAGKRGGEFYKRVSDAQAEYSLMEGFKAGTDWLRARLINKK